MTIFRPEAIGATAGTAATAFSFFSVVSHPKNNTEYDGQNSQPDEDRCQILRQKSEHQRPPVLYVGGGAVGHGQSGSFPIGPE